MGWNTSSIWLKTCLGCVVLATILFVLGFATNDWMESYNGASVWGLWKILSCSRYTCTKFNIRTIDLEVNRMEVWFRIVQIFECLGLICVAITFIVTLVVVFLTTIRKRVPLLVIIICGFAGVAAIILGVLIFATKMDHYEVAWSMGVAIAGAIFLFIGAIMAVIDLNR